MAIALDNTSNGLTPGAQSTLTVSHSCAGSNRLLTVSLFRASDANLPINVSYGTQTLTSATSPGTGADDATIGTIAWSNPGNVLADDANQVTFTTSGVALSHYLKATNFGFSIPSGKKINGIKVEIKRNRTGGTTGNVRDNEVKLVKADGSINSTNRADTATNWPTAAGYATYGGEGDLWGMTAGSLSDTDINDIDFGVVVSAKGAAAGADRVANIGHIRITIYYADANTIMTLIGSKTSGTQIVAMYYLVAPQTGANNIFVNHGIVGSMGLCGTSLTGVNQTTPLDAHNEASASNSTAATVNVATIADNTYIIGANLTVPFGSAASVVPSGTQIETADTVVVANGTYMASSYDGPKTPAGSKTHAYTITGTSPNWALCAASFAPSTAPTTSIKTFNGLAYASIKTVNGLAIASVKTINGLA